MAFKAELPTVYAAALSRATQTKKRCIDDKAAMLAGPVSASVIRQLLAECQAAKAELTAAAAVSGIGAYAQAQHGDAGYNVVTEWNTMITKLTDIINQIIADVPTGTGGYVLTEKWEATTFTSRTFSTAQTATLRNTLDAFIATVA